MKSGQMRIGKISVSVMCVISLVGAADSSACWLLAIPP